ncbi:MAG: DUF4422 domain-containing protein [Clostridium fessum]
MRELTAQYWAWKNEEADYYGFSIRRYLAFDPSLNKDDGWGILPMTASQKKRSRK